MPDLRNHYSRLIFILRVQPYHDLIGNAGFAILPGAPARKS